MSRTLIASSITLFLVTVASVSEAQSVKVLTAIAHEASAGVGSMAIEVTFDKSFGTDLAVEAARTAQNYRLLDLESKDPKGHVVIREIAVTATVEGIDLGLPQTSVPATSSNIVELTAAETLSSASRGRYALVLRGLFFGPQQTPIATTPVGIEFVALDQSPAGLLGLKPVAAKDRDAADLYFSGEFTYARPQGLFGSADVKVRYPGFQPVWRERIHVFSPTFDLKASSNPTADPDSAKAGLTWSWFPVVIPKGAIPTTQWDNVAVIEAAKDFSTRNFVWQTLATLMPRAIPVGAGNLWFDPVAGFEFGQVLKTLDGVGEGTVLSRGLIGGTATIAVPNIVGKEFTAAAGWQLRQLFHTEQVDGTTFEGTYPWLSLRAELRLTEFFSVSAAFENGRQPPKYKLVDKSFKFGITYKAAFKAQPVR